MAKIEIDNQNLKQKIFEKNIPIQKIADKSNISRTQLYDIVNGNQQKVFERTAFKLANFLKCTIADLKLRIK